MFVATDAAIAAHDSGAIAGLVRTHSASTSLINRCIHEAGRAVEPFEEQLVKELQQEILAYVDETPWKEWGQLLWLWVISTATVCLYLIGSRSTELLNQVFGEEHPNWLMSDGYTVYRRFRKRLRCWAHLLRKAKFLEECLGMEAQSFGKECRVLLETLMDGIYQVREGPALDLTPCYAWHLDTFRRLCERSLNASHAPTRALAREFLNDWDAIFRVLAHPFLPFTNNEAERALRHWVIVRRITQGTRTAQGTRAVGLLASIIETCRKRNILPWPYLAAVIAERRQGKTAPAVPAPSCA
ncbi:MAG: IS66 family transposase [Blastocatellia bacterium]